MALRNQRVHKKSRKAGRKKGFTWWIYISWRSDRRRSLLNCTRRMLKREQKIDRRISASLSPSSLPFFLPFLFLLLINENHCFASATQIAIGNWKRFSRFSRCLGSLSSRHYFIIISSANARSARVRNPPRRSFRLAVSPRNSREVSTRRHR